MDERIQQKVMLEYLGKTIQNAPHKAPRNTAKGNEKKNEIKRGTTLERMDKVPRPGNMSQVEWREGENLGVLVLPLTRALKTMVSNSSGPSSDE